MAEATMVPMGLGGALGSDTSVYVSVLHDNSVEGYGSVLYFNGSTYLLKVGCGSGFGSSSSRRSVGNEGGPLFHGEQGGQFGRPCMF